MLTINNSEDSNQTQREPNTRCYINENGVDVICIIIICYI